MNERVLGMSLLKLEQKWLQIYFNYFFLEYIHNILALVLCYLLTFLLNIYNCLSKFSISESTPQRNFPIHLKPITHSLVKPWVERIVFIFAHLLLPN